MVVIGVIGAAIGIVIALIIPWFPAKGSIQAGRIHTLYDVLLIATVPIFVLVETVVLFSVWKFRMRPGQEEMDGPPIHGNTRLEVVWTAVPAILIVALCTYAYTVLRANENTKPNEMTVNVTARQFAFQFSYPRGGRQAGALPRAVPAGQPAGGVQDPLARRDPQLLRAELLREARRGPGHHHHAPGDAERARHLPGRMHRAVRGRALADATRRCAWSARRPSRHWLALPAGQRAAADRVARRRRSTRPCRATSRAAAVVVLELVLVASLRPPRSAGASTSAAAGKSVFTGSAGCSGCHTLAAAAPAGTVGPDLDTRLKADCALRGLQEGPRRHPPAVHPDGDHQALRLPPDRLQRRDHALELRTASDL